jgi:hypothetical protein
MCCRRADAGRDCHWDLLTAGLEARESRGVFSADTRSRGLFYHRVLQKEDRDLHWLQRAVALIRFLLTFEKYREENGHRFPVASN